MMTVLRRISYLCSLSLALQLCKVSGFRPTTAQSSSFVVSSSSSYNVALYAVSNNKKLSELPQGISPFEKSLSKNIDVQADFRSRAKAAVETAVSSGVQLLEIEFPPLIGGDQVCLYIP